MVADYAVATGKALCELEAEGRVSQWSAAALRLLMLTGARSGEILSLTWDIVDYGRGALLLPKSKTGKKDIALNPQALAILQSIPRVNGNPYVIAGQIEGRPLKTLRQPWVHVSRRAKIESCRIHDLCHTYASFAAGSGYSLPVIGKILGHTVAATTQRYAHLADGVVREANDAIGSNIGAKLGLQSNEDRLSAEIIEMPVMPRRARGGR